MARLRASPAPWIGSAAVALSKRIKRMPWNWPRVKSTAEGVLEVESKPEWLLNELGLTRSTMQMDGYGISLKSVAAGR